MMQALGMSDAVMLGEATRQFDEVRPKLVEVAYRMIGSVAEAEDIVQEVWFRWQGANRSGIPFSTEFLMTVTVRLAFSCLQLAPFRQQTYIGPWLPDPVDTSLNLQAGTQQDDTLSFAVLVLMERLSPKERAAFILREVLHYPYAHVAAALQTNEEDARQLAVRARKYLNAEHGPHTSGD
ncbi:sigma factor-like helix-turn-helix DNA-binding protein [Streptomyces sp. CA-106110]